MSCEAADEEKLGELLLSCGAADEEKRGEFLLSWERADEEKRGEFRLRNSGSSSRRLERLLLHLLP